MTKLRLSRKGKVVVSIAVIVSFIILIWPFGGSKDDALYNNTLAIVKTIVGIIYLIWQRKCNVNHKNANLYGYNFVESDEIKAFKPQQMTENKNRYIFTCIICAIASICLLVSTFAGPDSGPIGLSVAIVTLTVTLLLAVYSLIINTVKLSFFTFKHIHDFYESFDFSKFVLSLPIVSDLFEQPETKEKENPTKKINL